MNACWIGSSCAVGLEPLDGRDRRAVGLDGEHRARLHRPAVEQHRARAAAARVAADVGAGEAEVLAQVVRRAARRGSTSSVCSVPLTVTVISTPPPLAAAAACSAAAASARRV